MSRSIDDSGANPLPHDPALDNPGPLPLAAMRGRDWLKLWGWHARTHPDMWAERDRDVDREARDLCLQAALAAQVPARMILALRHGDGVTRHDVYIHGLCVQLVTKTSTELMLTVAQEIDVWERLLRVIDEIEDAPSAPCEGFCRHPDLPAEIVVASWDRAGHRYYVCGDDASAGLRASRRGLGGLSGIAALLHIPSLAGIAQRLAELLTGPVAQTASTVAAVGVVTTASVAVPHLPAQDPAPPPIVQINAPSDVSDEPDGAPAPKSSSPASPLERQRVKPNPPVDAGAPSSKSTGSQRGTGAPAPPPSATPMPSPTPHTPPSAPTPAPSLPLPATPFPAPAMTETPLGITPTTTRRGRAKPTVPIRRAPRGGEPRRWFSHRWP